MRKTEKKFKVTGMQYYESDFFEKLAYENDDYSMTARELWDSYDEGERIYQYSFNDVAAELIPEPDNEYDPNAVRVEVGGVKIGHIKKGACSQVKNLLESPDFLGVRVEMGGGNYKTVYENEDDKVCVEKGTCNFFADVYISMRSEGSEDSSPSKINNISGKDFPSFAGELSEDGSKIVKKKNGGMIFLVIGAICAVSAISTFPTSVGGGILGLAISAGLIYLGLKKRK